MSKKQARDGTGKFVKKAEKLVDEAMPHQVMVPPTPQAVEKPAEPLVAGPGGFPEDAFNPPAAAPPQEAVARYGAGGDPRAANEMAEQYPTNGLSQAEEMDRLQLMKLGIGEKFGKQTFKDSDALWLLRKQEAAKKADFEAWFAQNYDRMDASHKGMARKLFPRFFQDRVKTADRNLETLRKLMHLRIRGVESKEDLALQYAADNGLLPMKELENLLHPEAAHAGRSETEQFARGLFNTNTYYMSFQQNGQTPSSQASSYAGVNTPLSDNFPLSGAPRANTTTARQAMRYMPF